MNVQYLFLSIHFKQKPDWNATILHAPGLLQAGYTTNRTQSFITDNHWATVHTLHQTTWRKDCAPRGNINM